jgi:uncharacterized membrane protein
VTALVFLFAVAVVFGAILAVEAGSAAARPSRPVGLFGWLTGGNWPAKVGGGLLVVGVGALLRYALINFELAPALKLLTGVVAAGVLGAASLLTRAGAAQRAVSLALGGAAFGVAYLTAYSAFALFHYVPSAEGVGLLLIIAVAAGGYAISRSALSLAMLSMVGAFLAPAFAVSDPGPQVVYSYYVAASLLTLVMVAARGWRPLIHLSFLFTLAGGVFFAWTAQYYRSENSSVMLPALAALAAIHLAMPIAERGAAREGWLQRLDLLYMLALPAVAALLALPLAPTRAALSNELLVLAALWLAAAGYLWVANREGSAAHAVIGLLLSGLGIAARFNDLPWELVALAFSAGALELASRRSSSRQLHSALAGLVALFGFLNVIRSLSPIVGSPVFLNGRFAERLVAAALMLLAGRACRRVRQSFDALLLVGGIGWALVAIAAELLRWDLVTVALIAHGALLAAAIVLAVRGTRSAGAANAALFIALGVLLTAGWAAVDAPLSLSWAGLVVAPLALLGLALRRTGDESATRTGALLSAAFAPIVAGVWAAHVGRLTGIDEPQFALSLAAGVALLVLLAGQFIPARSEEWILSVAEMFGFAFAALLGGSTLLFIGRSGWAVLLEVLSFAGLALLATTRRRAVPAPGVFAPLCAIGFALLLQAQMLRWLGPPGDLNAADIMRMRWPATISLLWAAVGGVWTVWARHRASRALWIGGATLLVAAAIKLVLVDFGSLGQLANILAVIAAGVVFMLVGWIAPFPPAAAPAPAGPEPGPQPQPVPAHTPMAAAPAAASESSQKKIAWIIAIIAVFVLPLAQCSRTAIELVRDVLSLGRSEHHAPAPRAPGQGVTVKSAASAASLATRDRE